jgi:hypothetical protein
MEVRRSLHPLLQQVDLLLLQTVQLAELVVLDSLAEMQLLQDLRQQVEVEVLALQEVA